MRTRLSNMLAIFAIGFAANKASGQTPQKLTLAQAERTALANHPRIASASLTADAANSVVSETRAPYYPSLTGAFTSVAAEHNTTLAVGAVQTSSLYSRAASGISFSQLITDFGRTAQLSASAFLRAEAQQQNVTNARAGILIGVDEAYYGVLQSATVLKVAQAVVENRRITLRQVQALAQSAMKSTLDVSFAEVALSDAELGLFRAENDEQESRARLGAAMGSTQAERAGLEDEPLPPPLEPDAESYLERAMQQRPDLAALRLNSEAAHRFAKAEEDLSRPTVSVAGVAGGVPATDPRLHSVYSAAGVNVAIPVLNGGLFSARRTEALLHAQAADRDVSDLSVQISEQVRAAWLEANTAFRRLDVTARLVEQADRSLRLAQTRYDAGLGSIVELNQAQLNQVSAEITAAGAKYEYLSRRAELSFATGALR